MFNFNKVKFVFFVILLLCLISKINANCNFYVENQLNKPILTQKFGSNELILSTWNSPIILNENERIEAYCGSGFRAFQVYETNYGSREHFGEGDQKLNFLCISNKIYVNHIYGGVRQKYLYDNPRIACKGSTYSMFESKDKLLNCNNAMSYVLGAKTNIPIMLAGLCYDLDKLNLKYVNYKLQDRSAVLNKTTELYPVGTNGNSLLEPINNIERFFQFPSNTNVKAHIATLYKSNFWLIIAEYEIASIIQTNISYEATLNEYSNFFNIVWWRTLRIGNWNRFVKLLEKRAEVVNYIIYSGTSGTVQIPKSDNCHQQTTTLEIDFMGGKKIVPQFIWTYLESTDENINEDFVVIAYNSPYYEYFPKNSTVICNDTCDEIEWMKPMNDSRYISTLGILYCCRVEEIVGLLDGFPKTRNDTLMTNEIMATTMTP